MHRPLVDRVLEVPHAALLFDVLAGDGPGGAELVLGARVQHVVLRGKVARAVVAVAAQGEAVHRLDGRQVEHAVRLAAAAGDAAIGIDLPDLRQAATGSLAALAAGRRRDSDKRRPPGPIACRPARRKASRCRPGPRSGWRRTSIRRRVIGDSSFAHFFSSLLLEFFSKTRTFAARPSSTSTRPWRSAARSAGVSVNCDGPATTV